MEKAYQFYLVRFKTEQYRLLDWATVAEISQTGLEDTGIINKTSRGVVIAVLDELLRSLMRFGRLDERLRPLTVPFIIEDFANGHHDRGPGDLETDMDQRFPQTNELLSKALAFVSATSKYPKKLRWAFCDKDKTEEVLSHISELNNSLRDLLSTEQMRLLQRHEVTTQCQIVQLNNKMDQLLEIVKGGLTNELVQMAKFKALLSSTSAGSLGESLRSKFNFGYPSGPSNFAVPHSAWLREDDILLDDTALQQPPPSQLERRYCGWYRLSDANAPKIKIWVESTSIEPKRYYDLDGGPDQNTMRRFQALVTLLRESQQTSQFRALPCLGYYQQTRVPTNARTSPFQLHYGLVFCLPHGLDPGAHIASLRQLLDRGFNASHNTVPSLSERLKLMRILSQSVERLHAVGWLHKALCSDNILFFCLTDMAMDVDISEPYISGFDYSRPDEAGSMSEAPASSSLLEDIYRHPGVQGQSPTESTTEREGFSRYHDIYSLGIMLLEIAEWRPIEAIVQDSRTHVTQTSLVFDSDRNGVASQLCATDVLNTRATLLQILSPPERSRLAAFVGNSIAKAIWSCIEGDEVFRTENSGQTENSVESARIQLSFFTAVTKPLFSVDVS
jgi:hypothetical protein